MRQVTMRGMMGRGFMMGEGWAGHAPSTAAMGTLMCCGFVAEHEGLEHEHDGLRLNVRLADNVHSGADVAFHELFELLLHHDLERSAVDLALSVAERATVGHDFEVLFREVDGRRDLEHLHAVGELFAVESARVVGVEDRVERLDLLGQVIHGAEGREGMEQRVDGCAAVHGGL